MKVGILIMCFVLCVVSVLKAQGPSVPSKITFADLELYLNDHVRREIQNEVEALHRSEKYFNIKLERVNLYFPIIERIFREEGIPDDFKFLVIQESALISDAVSTSNAVGFWQFKIPSAEEVGLRVDGNVDERLNITSSTHGAAKYLKRNNFFFNNWLYALLSYNMGVGGANQEVNDKYFGAKEMDLGRRTHWYIVKFLAHKVAFENYLYTNTNNRLYEYYEGGGQSLKQIAANLGVDFSELENYNKWLKRGKVPEDKLYAVIIPGLASPPPQVVKVTPSIRTEDASFIAPNSNLYPKIKVSNEDTRVVKINGIPGIIANDGEDSKSLALIGGLELSSFLKVNEIDISHRASGGEVYYFKTKRSKASEHYHTVLPGENLWSISQKYGVKKQKLLQKNRLNDEGEIRPGLVLWLRYIRSEDQPVEYVELPPAIIEDPEEKKLILSESAIQTDTVSSTVSLKTSYEEDEYEHIVHKMEEQPRRFADDAFNGAGAVTGAGDIDPSGDDNSEPASMDKPLFHLVQAGETLFAISRSYKVPIEDILKINDLQIEDNISIGQKIYLRDPFEEMNDTRIEIENSTTDSYITYTVKSGDTMYSISRQYNVTVDDIINWNEKSDYNLREGEILKLKISK